MKRITLLFSLCLVIIAARTQYYTWTQPVPLTDSLSDHTNCNIFVGDPMTGTDSTFVVWEQSDDTLSTAIYARNLNSMNDPFPLLSQQGVHYRNPKRVPVWDQFVQFSLFYETDINGNRDIYLVRYRTDGTLSDPVQVCATPADERNLQYADWGIVWQRNDAIVNQEYNIWSGFPPGSQPVVLDSGNCQNPSFSGYFCAWEKGAGTNRAIWYSGIDYVSGNWVWMSPEPVDSTGDNARPYTGDSFYPDVLVWQHKEGTLWNLRGMELDYMTPYTMPDFPGFNNTEPWFLNVILPVWNSYPFPASFLTWVSDSTGNREIFVNETMWDPVYFNISGFSEEDRNPRLFATYGYDIRVYLTWESFRNGHWQIWITWQDIPVGIPDDAGTGSSKQVTACPNPFSVKTMIGFNALTCGPYRVQVYSCSGQEVLSRTEDAFQPGSQQFEWDGRDLNGDRLPSGVYLVRIHEGTHLLSGKVVLH